MILIKLINTSAGMDITTGEEVAIKLELVHTKHPQLHIESRIYKLMQGGSEGGGGEEVRRGRGEEVRRGRWEEMRSEEGGGEEGVRKGGRGRGGD